MQSFVDGQSVKRGELDELRHEMRQHYATKEDLANLRWQLGGLIIAVGSLVFTALRFWPD